MSLIEHAQSEFNFVGWPGDCEMQQAICKDTLELLQTFSDQGHSGFSANYLLGIFEKLVRFHPISPLTGEPDEWREVSPDLLQNKRCGEVFKSKGKAYWIRGKIFRDPDGGTYTSGDSHVPIEFPWMPTDPEIVDVPAETE